MRRFLVFLKNSLDKTDLEQFKLSSELIEFYHSVRESLSNHLHLLDLPIDGKTRKELLDQLGSAASEYRHHIYKSGFWGKKRSASIQGLKNFIENSLIFINHTIDKNKRKDGLFHAYNLMTYTHETVDISHLDEMLEGQVAVLSSGKLTTKEALSVLDSMKNSALFRPDQYSYILYPNKNLTGFLQKNIISEDDVMSSQLFLKCLKSNNKTLIERDVNGRYHFNGNFKNAIDLKAALESFRGTEFEALMEKEQSSILEIFEKIFNHKAFTGRSGTFFGYEGLGSIYWHMVSKLLLAVQENCLLAIQQNENTESIGRLLDHYYEIQAGIGVHKSPELYGAFPTDPYSHTPMHKGAQQPGMTGQVKEDILCRIGELGLIIENGQLTFYPCLLRKSEFLTADKMVTLKNLNGKDETFKIESGQLIFTYCQVPIIYEMSDEMSTVVFYSDGYSIKFNDNRLNIEDSQALFNRKDRIKQIKVCIDSNVLK